MTFDDLKYQLRYGKEARLYRGEIERILRILKQEEADDVLHWWYQSTERYHARVFLGEMLDYHQGKIGFSMFEHGRFASNYKPYSWMYASALKEEKFTFSIDELSMMIAFARNAKRRDEDLKHMKTIQTESKQLDFVAENCHEYKQLVENVKQAEKNMKEILNPVSRKFNDLRNTEECLDDYMPMLLNAPIKPVEPLLLEHNSQVESVRQLTEVVHNQYVSEETKTEARNLLEEITTSLKEEEKEKLQEMAEMNALAVIATSRQVHLLPKQ